MPARITTRVAMVGRVRMRFDVAVVQADSGLPVHPREAYRGFVGNGQWELAKRALPANKQKKSDLDKVTGLFRAHYANNWHLNTSAYPGILYLIKLCVARHLKVAVLTNKDHEFTKKMVRHFFRGSMINLGKNPFGLFSGGSADQPMKPDPARALELAALLKAKPEHIAILGDSPVDIQTAINAGMIPLGAAWGYSGRKLLEEAGALMVFDSPTDIVNLFEQAPIIQVN